MDGKVNELNKIYYETGAKLLESETTHLFQRFNYFLLGTSFLIASFVAVITAYYNTRQTYEVLLTLAYLINTGGIWLAWIFSTMSLNTARIINHFSNEIVIIEEKLVIEEAVKPPYKTAGELSTKYSDVLRIDSFSLFSGIINTIRAFTKRNPNQRKQLRKETPFSHPWIVSCSFMILWMIIWPSVFGWFDVSNFKLVLTLIMVLAFIPFVFQILGFWYWIPEKRREQLMSKIKNWFRDTFTI